jgi:two-component system, OmpR family, heavy metal sensor histidine kinase CusS
MTRSLAGGLALGGVAWIGVWAVALLVLFNVLLSQVLAGQVDTGLRARAEAVAATVEIRGGRLEILTEDDEALDLGTSIYLGRTLVEGSDLGSRLTAELLQRGEVSTDRETLGPVRYLAYPIRSGGRQVGTIVVSSDIGARTRTEWIVALASAGFIVILLLFTYAALRATIERALRPVRVMGDQASAWGEQDIDRRFEPDAGPLELRQLALTLNALLERIAATVRRERRFTAELSHELRTPLAHLHAEVDLLTTAEVDPTRPERVTAEDLNRLRTSILRLEDLVESALTPARAGQNDALGLGRVDELLSDLPRPPAATAVLTVQPHPDLVLAVNTDIARRALLPVLENAWRYAEREIRVTVAAADALALISVSDDAGRLDPALVEAVFEPGFRADPGDGHPGAGLGLALTRRICRAAGGEATASVAGGRTTLTLHLPRIES